MSSPNSRFGNVNASMGSGPTVVLFPAASIVSISTNGPEPLKPTWFSINGEEYQPTYANGSSTMIDRREKTPVVSIDLFSDGATGQTYAIVVTKAV